MEICRACLLTEPDMVPLDEFCVTNYNLLTDLKIIIGDNMPQHFCQNCLNMIKVFIDFREKAIISENTLREITENTVPDNLCDDKKYIHDDSKIKVEFNDNATDYQSLDHDVYCVEEDVRDIDTQNVQDSKLMLQCGLCKKKFPDKTMFVTHLKVHKKGGKCKLCFEKLKIGDLYAHTMVHLQAAVNEDAEILENVKLEIPDCGFFTSSQEVKEEKKIRQTRKGVSLKRKKTKHSCGLCKMIFDSKALLSKHLDSHKVEGSCSCKICHEVFNCWPQLFGHRVAHLPPKERHCHLCNRWFITQTGMEFHYRMKHYDGEDKFLRCKHCLRTYENARKLSKHILSSHGAIKYICDYCKKGCHTKEQLRVHIPSHGYCKPYVCDLCGFTSKLLVGLKNHKLRKHDPRKIICKTCDRVFADEEKVAKHKCNVSIMICPECGKELKSKRSLSRHIRSHRPDISYKCPRCPNSYRSNSALKEHLYKHDGKRTMQCEYCDAAFFTKAVLVKHRRIHTGEKPFVCKICHRGFTGGHNLKVHMRIHGEDLIVKRQKTLPEPNPFTTYTM